MDLDSVAAELYGLKPAEFTSARDTRSAEARRDGDKELAGAIKALKRPSVSAWLANVVVRERSEEVGRLLALGESLRDAQQQLAGDQLRALSQQRHRVVSALVQDAVGLASARGQAAGPAAQRELQETLEAALSDPAAAEALGAGRLTAALSYSGLGTQGLELGTGAGGPAGAGEGVERQAAVREAEAELAATERRRDQQREELGRAERDRDRVARRIEELTGQLEDLRAQLPKAEQAVGRLREQLAQTSAEVDAAGEQVERVLRCGGG